VLPSTSLIELMKIPLPSKRYQRKKKYQPKIEDVHQAYDLLNTHIFDGKLKHPSINLRNLNVWGMCIGFSEPKHYTKIKLNYRFFCIQWMIMILAHEMCHQYQWSVLGADRITSGRAPLLSHGPSFFIFRKKLASFGIPLKTTYDEIKWIKRQKI
jgi:hypothetical protein